MANTPDTVAAAPHQYVAEELQGDFSSVSQISCLQYSLTEFR